MSFEEARESVVRREERVGEKVELSLSVSVEGLRYIERKGVSKFKGLLKVLCENPLVRNVILIPNDTDIAVEKHDHIFNLRVRGSLESVYYIALALRDYVEPRELPELDDWLEEAEIKLFGREYTFVEPWTGKKLTKKLAYVVYEEPTYLGEYVLLMYFDDGEEVGRIERMCKKKGAKKIALPESYMKVMRCPKAEAYELSSNEIVVICEHDIGEYKIHYWRKVKNDS